MSTIPQQTKSNKRSANDRPSVLESLGIKRKPIQKERQLPPEKVEEKSIKLAEKRIQLLASLAATQPSRELLSACRSGDLPRAQFLLHSVPSTDVNYQSPSSEDGVGKHATALHFAAVNDHPEILSLLLASGADPRLVTDCGQSALHVAAKRGHANAVKILITENRGSAAELRVMQDTLGKTALAYSIAGTGKGHKAVMKLLGH